jgi:acid phosphatase (class A)
MTRRIRLWLTALFAVACGFSGATAQTAATGAMAAKAPATSKFLQPSELDASVVVPPPPADGSTASAIELTNLHSLTASRTPERLARAEHDAAVEDATVIAEVFGPALDLRRLPATRLLFADLRNEDGVAAKAAKKYFRRPRPWEVDAALAADPAHADCDPGEPNTSYPSGHATMGYAAAEVFAQLMPGNAQLILARASDYAESRLICAAHFPSDLEAGHVLATALVAKLMSKPEFQAEFEAARAELTAAHLAP